MLQKENLCNGVQQLAKQPPASFLSLSFSGCSGAVLKHTNKLSIAGEPAKRGCSVWVIILFSFFFFLSPASTRALAQLLALLHCHLTADGALHGGWHLQTGAWAQLLGRNREVCTVVGMQCGRLWSAPGSHV